MVLSNLRKDGGKVMGNGYKSGINEQRNGKYRILVVDDDGHILSTLSFVLSAFGHSVSLASDGDEGIREFGCRPYDLILTDLEMPGSDGIKLASHVKALSPGTPVVLMTGHRAEDVKKRLSGNHVDSIIYKPFGLKEIQETISKILG